MCSFYSGIGLDIFYAHLGKVLTILNIYGPYVNRVPLWNSLLNKDFASNREVTLTSPWDVLRYGALRRFWILWNPCLLMPFPVMIYWILLQEIFLQCGRIKGLVRIGWKREWTDSWLRIVWFWSVIRFDNGWRMGGNLIIVLFPLRFKE